MEQTQKLIVVTGGAGFIGTHLCRRLMQAGHKVISLDNYFTGSRENHIEGVEYREGHTKDIDELIPETPDLVFHLGEYSRVEKSFEDVEQAFDLNKIGTFAVLQFVRSRGCKIVYAGSSTKFGDGGLGRDQGPYAWMKATNTELVKNYSQWFGISYAITYFYNVYGPGERAGAFGTLIEIFRQNTLTGKPLTVVSPGTQQRNFTHVDDIVDGLILVGEKGEGDDFGLGDPKAYSVLDVAQMFGGEIVMLPERAGNRMGSVVNTEKSEALGWSPKRSLADYISSIKKDTSIESAKEKRILVFTTTFYPTVGPAEKALCTLMNSMPDIHFDIISAAGSKEGQLSVCPVSNATIHYVGSGSRFDKFLLLFLGGKLGRELSKKHNYLFSWSIMASYGTVAALSVKRDRKLPLLVTLADQSLSWYEQLFLRFVIKKADQVYASLPKQYNTLSERGVKMRERNSLGVGDAFANQIRFAYSDILSKQYRTVLRKK